MKHTPPLVAIIDDDQAYIDVMVDILQDEGYVCVSALTDGDALSVVQEHTPDLVILDLRMHFPDSGLRILDALRHSSKTATIPVLVCSGDRVTLRTKHDWLHRHGCDTLEKPFHPEELLEKGQRLLRAHRTVNERNN